MLDLSPSELFLLLFRSIFLKERRFKTFDLGLTLSIFPFEFLYSLITLLFLPLKHVEVAKVLTLYVLVPLKNLSLVPLVCLKLLPSEFWLSLLCQSASLKSAFCCLMHFFILLYHRLFMPTAPVLID